MNILVTSSKTNSYIYIILVTIIIMLEIEEKNMPPKSDYYNVAQGMILIHKHYENHSVVCINYAYGKPTKLMQFRQESQLKPGKHYLIEVFDELPTDDVEKLAQILIEKVKKFVSS